METLTQTHPDVMAPWIRGSGEIAILAEGRTFRCSAAILRRLPYYDRILGSGLTTIVEHREPFVGVYFNLEFIYTNSSKFLETLAFPALCDVLRTAIALGNTVLLSACRGYFRLRLSAATLEAALRCCETTRDGSLTAACLEFLRDSADIFAATADLSFGAFSVILGADSDEREPPLPRLHSIVMLRMAARWMAAHPLDDQHRQVVSQHITDKRWLHQILEQKGPTFAHFVPALAAEIATANDPNLVRSALSCLSVAASSHRRMRSVTGADFATEMLAWVEAAAQHGTRQLRPTYAGRTRWFLYLPKLHYVRIRTTDHSLVLFATFEVSDLTARRTLAIFNEIGQSARAALEKHGIDEVRMAKVPPFARLWADGASFIAFLNRPSSAQSRFVSYSTGSPTDVANLPANGVLREVQLRFNIRITPERVYVNRFIAAGLVG